VEAPLVNLQDAKALATRLVNNRQNYDSLVEDVQDLVLPFRGDIDSDWGPNIERMGPTFDPVGVVSLHMLASYLQGSIFSNNTDWLRLSDPTGATPQGELDMMAIRVLEALDDSNFYTAMGSCLRDMAGIGNGTLLVEPRPERLQPDGSLFGGVDFEAVPYAAVYRKLDRMGRPLAILRKFKLWPEEARDFFGGVDVGSPDDEGKINLCNLITREGSKYCANWWVKGAETFLVPETKYDYCPYVCGMWDQTEGFDYGYGIGHQVRPCLAGLQELARETIQAVGRDLNPLLMAESDSFADLDVGQNGVVTVKRGIAMRPEFLRSESNFAAADQIRRQDVEQVQRAFFVDALMGPETQERSAEATRARQAKLATRMAGPAQRISLFLSDVVGAVIGCMVRSGGIVLSGPVRPVFISPFFANAKMSSVDRINTFVAQQAQIASLLQNPEFLDAIDMDAVAEVVAELSDIPHQVLKSPEALAAQKEQRAAAAAEERINAAAQAGTLQQPGMETQLELGRQLPRI
jgi:hypothetical protein